VAPEDLAPLIARLGTTGDPAVLGQIFDRAAPGLLRLALRVTGDPTEAEDVLQETFLAVLRGARTYDPSRPAGAWLATVLSHAAARRRRRRAPRPLATGEAEAVASPLSKSDPETWRRARVAIEGLPAREKSALLLRHEHGLPTARIAEILGIEESSVRSLLTRGTDRLRKRLGPSSAAFLPLAPWPSLDHLLAHVRDRLFEGALGSTAAGGSAAAATTWLAGGLLVTHKTGIVAAAALVLLVGAGTLWHLEPSDVRDAQEVSSAPLEPAQDSAPLLQGAPGPAPARGSVDLASSRKVARYSGTLRDVEGNAVPGAQLEVTEVVSLEAIDLASLPRVVPDEQGCFGFEVDRSMGQVTVRVHAEGYVPRWGGADGQLVFPNHPLDIVLERGVQLDMKVVDAATEKPVADAIVGIYEGLTRSVDAWKQQKAKHGTVTDAAGRAVLLGKEGPATLRVQADGYRAAFVPDLVVGGTGGPLTVRMQRGTRVLGRFVDTAGRPKAGVLVEVSGFPPYEAKLRSDADGRFTLEHAPSLAEPPEPVGRYHLRLFAQIPGSGERYRHFRVDPAADEGGVAEVTLVWAPERALRGRVRSAAGEPVPDLWISASPAWTWDMHWAAEPVKSDAEGRFELVKCVPDRLRVKAVRGDRPGGGPALAEAFVILPVEGEAPEVDLVVPGLGGPGKSLTVRVLDPQGAPVPGARVQRTVGETMEQVEPRADGTLRIEAGLQAGMAIVAGAPGWAPFRVELTSEHLAAGALDVVMPAGSVRGHVVRSDGRPLATALSIYGVRRVPGVTRALYVMSPYTIEFGSSGDGSFEFRGLGEDEYRIGVRSFGDGAVASGHVTVRAGQADVRIVLLDRAQTQAQTVEVEVLDEHGKPLRNLYVMPWLVPPGARAEGEPVALLQLVDGTEHLHRTFYPVPAGTYDLVLPAMFGFREARATGIQVPGKTRSTLRLDRGLRVRGRVLDAAGLPAAGVYVHSGEQKAPVTKDGSYELTGLEEGDVDVEISDRYAVSDSRRLRLSPGEPPQVDFQVVTGGAILLAPTRGAAPLRRLRAEAVPLAPGQPVVLEVLAHDRKLNDRLVLPRLPPGRWRVDVDWDGRRIASEEVEVKDRETVTLNLAP
jgi:RNA polymerase sigma-70 factor (ECF subfamily)